MTTPPPERLAASESDAPLMQALAVQLHTSSEFAARARVRVASPEEARRTNAPGDWHVVVVDGWTRGRPEDLSRLRAEVAAFLAGARREPAL